MSLEMIRERPVILGMQANWELFTLLVVVNAFVGGMVGLERTILPLIALEDFGIASKAAAISFIITFGVTKAAVNFLPGAFPTIGAESGFSCSAGSLACPSLFLLCLPKVGSGSFWPIFCLAPIRP